MPVSLFGAGTPVRPHFGYMPSVLRLNVPNRCRLMVGCDLTASRVQPHPYDHGESCRQHGVELRSTSFEGALQTLEAFQPEVASQRRNDAEPQGSLPALTRDDCESPSR